MKLEQQVCVAHDGTELVVHKATGRPGAEPLVFLHANGFSVGTYVDLIGLLSAQFTVYAIDQRGHGASADGPASSSGPLRAALKPQPPHSTAQLEAPRITQEQLQARMAGFPIPVTDLLEILDQLGLEHPLCFGHSLGGSMALLAEIFRPRLWKAVCVFEPPVTATEEQDRGNKRASARRALAARNRRKTFHSFAAAKERLQGKSAFSLFTPSSFDGFITSCFVPDDSGGVSLRCTVEAEIFETAWLPASIIRDNIHTMACPVTFCRGVLDPTSLDNDMVVALDHLASWCPRSRLYSFPALNHMGPLSHPAVVARVICESLLGGQKPAINQAAADAQPRQLVSRL